MRGSQASALISKIEDLPAFLVVDVTKPAIVIYIYIDINSTKNAPKKLLFTEVIFVFFVACRHLNSCEAYLYLGVSVQWREDRLSADLNSL